MFSRHKQPITSEMVTHSKIASGGILASAERSARAGSTKAINNDAEVKVEVKREPGIDVFEKVTMWRMIRWK